MSLDAEDLPNIIRCDRCRSIVLIDQWSEGFNPEELKAKMDSHYAAEHPYDTSRG